MAYVQDAALISDVQTAAAKLGVASSWASGSPVLVKDDFLYELHLLFRLLSELSEYYNIDYLPGSGSKMHEFPRSPAAKAGRPRFNVLHKATKAVILQVCAGTKAEDSSGKERGLDVSFQSANATDSPVATDVLQIFDAKYRADPQSRISHLEFAGFSHWVELFTLRGGARAGLFLGRLSQLNDNCLVTNGQASTEENAECVRIGVREVTKFRPNNAVQSRP